MIDNLTKRITNETTPTWRDTFPAPYWQSWTFDAASNRKSQTVHASAGDATATYGYPPATSVRPHAVTDVAIVGPGVNRTDSYGYDANGSMTSPPGTSS